MTSQLIARVTTFPYFNDTTGLPLNNGRIWIGLPNTDPRQQANQIGVFYDQAGSFPAPQPLATLNGHIARTGAATDIYVAQTPYSIYVENQQHVQVYYGASASDFNIAQFSVVVQSVAALRQLTKSVGQTARTIGYYGPGSGGGGLYYYDATDTTSADNGGTVIVANDGGRWKLQLTGDVTWRQFGAKGDGVTDDTAAIRSAVSTVPSTDPESGTYLTSGPITLANNYQSIMATGTATILKSGTTGYDGLKITGNYCTVRGLSVNGNNVGLSGLGGSGVGITGAYNIVTGCASYANGAHGFYFDGQSTLCVNNLLENNNSYSNGQVGFSSNTAADNVRVGNIAYNNGYEGFTNDAPSFRSLITGNKSVSNCQTGGVGGIGIDQASGAVITGNVVNNTRSSRPGLQFQNNLAGTNLCTVTGNTVTDNTGGGIRLYANTGATGGPFYASYNIIGDNNFQNNANFDIQIDSGCVGNVISGISTQAVVKDFNRGGINPKSGYGVSFRAYANTARTGVTGNGATYTIPFDGVFVNNANAYNPATGIFTAPIAGVYHLTAACRLQGGSTETYGQLKIVQAGGFSQTAQNEVDAPTVPSNAAIATINLAVNDMFYMATGDTAQVEVFASGASSNDMTIPASPVQTYFSGCLIG